MTDHKALCAELLVLAEESISYRAQVSEAVQLIDRARAALAEPEPGCQTLADLAWSDTTTIAPSSASINGCIYRLIPMDEPKPPADGELAELVTWLRLKAEDRARDGFPVSAAQYDRAADLLERLTAPEPAGPTLDDISDLCEEFGFHLDGNGEYNDTLESAEALWEICRAVLARWGQG